MRGGEDMLGGKGAGSGISEGATFGLPRLWAVNLGPPAFLCTATRLMVQRNKAGPVTSSGSNSLALQLEAFLCRVGIRSATQCNSRNDLTRAVGLGTMSVVEEFGRSFSLDEFHRRRRRNDARPVPFRQQALDRLPAARPVVQGPVVDVHADEAVRQGFVHVAGVPEGVIERRAAVVQGV